MQGLLYGSQRSAQHAQDKGELTNPQDAEASESINPALRSSANARQLISGVIQTARSDAKETQSATRSNHLPGWARRC